MQPNAENVNTSLLKSSNFKMLIDTLPRVSFAVQQANIPGFSISNIVVPTPIRDIPQPGSKLYLEPLTVSFLVDEDLTNWQEIRSWIYGLAFPEEFSEYVAQLASGLYSDIEIAMLTNNSNYNFSVVFKDAFPTSLTSIELSTTDTNVSPVLSTVGFQYNNYDIIQS